MERVVILGAGYAGMACALRLSKRARGKVEITLINERDRLVERIRLHEHAASARPREHALDGFLRGTGVRLLIGRASAIDTEARCVTVGEERVPFDRLVLALGSRVDVDRVPGAREHAYTLDAGRAGALASKLASLGEGARVVIVGGGLTGIEAATELAETAPGLDITLLAHEPVAEGWSRTARTHVLGVLERLGVAVREGVRVGAVHADHVETDGGPVPCDVCVWAAGFAFPTLPREAGLAVSAHGQVEVDACLRSVSHPYVYAAGDVAAPTMGYAIPMGCKSALPMGAFLGENLARLARGEREQPFDYSAPLFCVSLGRKDGLVQLTRPDGSLTGRALTGRAAAWVKEQICKSTVFGLRLERRGIRAVMWTKAPQHMKALPAPSQSVSAAS